MERNRRRHQLPLRRVVFVTAAFVVMLLSVVVLWGGLDDMADSDGVASAGGKGEQTDEVVAPAATDDAAAAVGDEESGDEGGTPWDSSHTALVERVVGSGRMRLYEDSAGLEGCASELLRSYEESGDRALVRSGYLDLAGSVWSCTVQGPKGVDVCFVCERADGEGCQVRVLSMGESEWKDLYAQVEKATSS